MNPQRGERFFFFQTLIDDNIQEHLEHGDPPWQSGLTVGREQHNQYKHNTTIYIISC